MTCYRSINTRSAPFHEVDQAALMGIPGLLPILKSITIRTHISDFNGKKVAVDGYSWLHRGKILCSQALCEGKAPTK